MKSIDNLFTKIGSYPWRGDSDMADFDALVEATQDEMRESYIKLPLDADDVPIRLGDEVYQVEGGWVYTVKSITFYPENTTVSFECEHGFGCDSAHNVRHYHEPTVEDVLREFTHAILNQKACYREQNIAEYAVKLRLADEKEQ